MTDYKTTIPGTVHNKQLLIIDTGETTDTTSFNGRLVEEFEQSFHQSGTNGTPLLSKFKVTFIEPFITTKRCYLKLDNISIAGVSSMTNYFSSTTKHNAGSHDYKGLFPGVRQPSSLFHFNIEEIKINNTSNSGNELSLDSTKSLNKAYDTSQSCFVSVNPSQPPFPIETVQVMKNNKHDILGIVNPIRTNTLTFNFFWAKSGLANYDAASAPANRPAANFNSVNNKTRIVIELLFEPI